MPGALAALLVTVLGSCGGTAKKPAPISGSSSAPGHEITLYRDKALITHRIAIDVPVADKATVKVVIPAGVTVDDVVILERGDLIVSEMHGDIRPLTPKPEPSEDIDTFGEDAVPDDPTLDNGELDLEENPFEFDLDDDKESTDPTEITFVVSAPSAGRHVLTLGYVTPRLDWDAAYTMTTTPARDRVTMRGAIAIRNRTGIVLKGVHGFVVDAELGVWRGRIAEQLGSTIGGATASTTPMPVPRSLGNLDLGTGETRIELLPDDPPRQMRSVLVYDPIGTKNDHSGPSPIRDANLGTGKPVARVTESFEIVRPRTRDPRVQATGEAATVNRGLPSGPVRLLERAKDGSLHLLGESRLFDAATRVAEVDTIPIGTASGVVGRRERREISVDEEGKRLVEEFVITIENKRDVPVEVVIREHLYRGQNWTLAYQTARDPTKEGPQQISLRTNAPAKGEAKVMYVVVYTWQ